MIGITDFEGSKCNVAMNGWQRHKAKFSTGQEAGVGGSVGR